MRATCAFVFVCVCARVCVSNQVLPPKTEEDRLVVVHINSSLFSPVVFIRCFGSSFSCHLTHFWRMYLLVITDLLLVVWFCLSHGSAALHCLGLCVCVWCGTGRTRSAGTAPALW